MNCVCPCQVPYVYSWVIKHFKIGIYNGNTDTSLNMLMLIGNTIINPTEVLKDISVVLEEDILASAWSEACHFCSSNHLNVQWRLRSPGLYLTLQMVPVCTKKMCLISKSFSDCNMGTTAFSRTCNFTCVHEVQCIKVFQLLPYFLFPEINPNME